MKIGAVVDGVVLGWGFRDADIGTELDADGKVIHVGGWTVAELEDLLAAISECDTLKPVSNRNRIT